MSCLMMSPQTCRECRLVVVAFLNPLSTAVQPGPCVLAQPFILLCQLCHCVSSRNSLRFNLISSVSLPIQAQIVHGETLPAIFQYHFHQPVPTSQVTLPELQPYSAVFCFVSCPSFSMSPHLPAEPCPRLGQVGAACLPPTPRPNPAAAMAYGEVQQS